MTSTPVLSSATSHFPLSPVTDAFKCLPAGASRNSLPSSIAFLLSTHISALPLKRSSVTSTMSVRIAIPACREGIRDINHLAREPFFPANPPIGGEFRSTEENSQMFGFASFYSGRYEFLSQPRLARAWTISLVPSYHSKHSSYFLMRFFPVLWKL